MISVLATKLEDAAAPSLRAPLAVADAAYGLLEHVLEPLAGLGGTLDVPRGVDPGLHLPALAGRDEVCGAHGVRVVALRGPQVRFCGCSKKNKNHISVEGIAKHKL